MAGFEVIIYGRFWVIAEEHLSKQKAHTVTMTFAEIEAVLGSKLPPSARKYAQWWENATPETGQHPYSAVWMRAGRRATVNLTAERVVFDKST
jgi:hypothetical protein